MDALKHIHISRKILARRKSKFANYTGAVLLAASCLLAFSGCGSSSSNSQLSVGPITFTDATGASQDTRKILFPGASAYMDVTLTDDPQQLGVNWSMYCGSAPPPGTPLPPGQTQDQSCGTFTPVHTLSGPIPSYVTNANGYVALYTAPAAPPKSGTVTLYATATSNPSRLSTATLIIDPQSISIALTSTPPATLPPGASTSIAAVVNHDPTNSGLIWNVTCEVADCGSINPGKTASGAPSVYTAPALSIPSGVQITAASAADPNKSVSFDILILPASSSAMREVTPSLLEAAPFPGSIVSTSKTSRDGHVSARGI